MQHSPVGSTFLASLVPYHSPEDLESEMGITLTIKLLQIEGQPPKLMLCSQLRTQQGAGLSAQTQ